MPPPLATASPAATPLSSGTEDVGGDEVIPTTSPSTNSSYSPALQGCVGILLHAFALFLANTLIFWLQAFHNVADLAKKMKNQTTEYNHRTG
jgi:hypothetical protein